MSETGRGGAGGFPGGPGDEGAGSRVGLAWALRGAEEARVATETRLHGIRAVLAAIESEGPRALPSATPGWHSPAAAAYSEQLQGLHAALAGVIATLHSAEAAAWRELAGWEDECERLGRQLRQALEAAGG